VNGRHIPHVLKRRELVMLLASVTALAWPRRLYAQQPALPVVGVISAGVQSGFEDRLAVLRLTLKDNGFIEGQTRFQASEAPRDGQATKCFPTTGFRLRKSGR
jgi:hypothetical protein